MRVEIIYVTKDGCGICHLMVKTWRRLKNHKPWWEFTQFHISNNHEAKQMLALGVEKTPSWIVKINGKVAGIVSGGMKFSTLIRKIDEIVG